MANKGRYRAPMPPKMSDPFDGVIVIDKPAGPTSHDVVDAIRKKFQIKKVGHGGTLDPNATGVLVILTGKGTKLSNKFMTSDKTYEGTIHLGSATDSQDSDGEVVMEGDCSNVTVDMLKESFSKMTGDMMQTPPMVSAVKVDGVPLYKRARRGETVEREPRFIHVYEFSLLEFGLPDSTFVLRCTKGTYVRTLCHDVGEALGCGAHLSELRRTVSGAIEIDQATPFEDVMNMTRDALMDKVIPIHKFGTQVPQ